LKDYLDAEKGDAFYDTSKEVFSSDYSYATTGSPTSFSLQRAISKLEGGDQTLVVPSGLYAISIVLLSLLNSGDHLLMVDNAYWPTRRFCDKELKRLGIETTYYDPLIGEGVKDLIKDNTKVIFVESPGSFTFEVQDIPAIAKAAKSKNVLTVADNSWATPLFFKPLEHGIDISLHAGTKYFSGHSDVLIGTITTSNKLIKKLYGTYRNFGATASPDDCYLTMRGLKTLSIRVARHEKSALIVAKWLEKRKEVTRILHPAFPSCPGHKIFERDFKGSTGLFAFVLDKKYSIEALSKMIDGLKYFGIGCSWGGFESLILSTNPAACRSVTKWEDKNSVIRLYIGLEDTDDLIEDLEKGLKRLG